MTSYTVLTDEELDSGKPLTAAKLKALRDNPLAIGEADPTAPRYGQGFITGNVLVISDVLTSSVINESVDGVGSAATISYNSTQNSITINLNVDWSSAGKGKIILQTTDTTNNIAPVTPQFLMSRNVIGVSSLSIAFVNCYNTNGNPVDSFEFEFIITYDRTLALPV